MVMEVNAVQPENTPLPIVVTLFGMVMEVNAVQPENTSLPIVVTLFGMVKEVNDDPIGNAIRVVLLLLYKIPFSLEYLELLLFTSMEVNPVQRRNALLGILVTLLPKTMDVRLALSLNTGLVTV